jgi:7-cyano-7-deazaguanine synthase
MRSLSTTDSGIASSWSRQSWLRASLAPEITALRRSIFAYSGIRRSPTTSRNTIFLSFALAWAEVLEANDIVIGVNALDYSGYPDCRPEFIEAFERMSNLATRAGVEGRTRIHVRAPLIQLSKADIVRLGRELKLPFELTHSCYDPDAAGRPCGACDSCVLRAKGFREAGIADPAFTR